MVKYSEISRFFPQLIHHPIGIATLSAAGLGEKSAFARSTWIRSGTRATEHGHLKVFMLFAILTFLATKMSIQALGMPVYSLKLIL